MLHLCTPSQDFGTAGLYSATKSYRTFRLMIKISVGSTHLRKISIFGFTLPLPKLNVILQYNYNINSPCYVCTKNRIHYCCCCCCFRKKNSAAGYMYELYLSYVAYFFINPITSWLLCTYHNEEGYFDENEDQYTQNNERS